jgi:hypothetical protein
VKAWSDAHPGHLPLFINIESKIDSPADEQALALFNFQQAPAFDASSPNAIDAEVISVFGDQLDKIITPDKLRGNLATLNDVVVQKKWPQLKDCRGKIIFILEGALVGLYKTGHPSLSGRTMFIYAEPGTPEAAFLIYNDPLADHDLIMQYVQQGYVVRTRCDADTKEARSGDYSRMYAAFTSGAQINSTDYYKMDDRAGQTGWTNYRVHFPEGEIARKNPVNAVGIPTENDIKE